MSILGVSDIVGDPRVAELEDVSLNRKKTLNLLFTRWSTRTLVESIEPGLDQVPMNWPNPFAASSSPLGLGSGNALIAGRSALPAGILPAPGPDVGHGAIPLMQRSGTGLAVAACGAVSRNPSYETKKNVLSLP